MIRCGIPASEAKQSGISARAMIDRRFRARSTANPASAISNGVTGIT